MTERFIVEFPEPDEFLKELIGDVSSMRLTKMQAAFPEARITQYIDSEEVEPINYSDEKLFPPSAGELAVRERVAKERERENSRNLVYARERNDERAEEIRKEKYARD